MSDLPSENEKFAGVPLATNVPAASPLIELLKDNISLVSIYGMGEKIEYEIRIR